MSDGMTEAFDAIDPFERTLLRRVQAWSDQAAAALAQDPATVVRATTTVVGARRWAAPFEGRWAFVASMAFVVALVAGGLGLRFAPIQSAQPSDAPTVDASLEATNLGTPGPELTPSGSDLETPEASVEPEPTFESLEPGQPEPTSKPRRTADPDTDPTPKPAWTPIPGFDGSMTVSDVCHHADGTEEVSVVVSFDSPVDVTMVEAYMDGEYFARGGPAPGDELVGSVTLGRVLEVGATVFPTALVFTGPTHNHLIAKVEGDPFFVPQGSPCPGG